MRQGKCRIRNRNCELLPSRSNGCTLRCPSVCWPHGLRSFLLFVAAFPIFTATLRTRRLYSSTITVTCWSLGSGFFGRWGFKSNACSILYSLLNALSPDPRACRLLDRASDGLRDTLPNGPVRVDVQALQNSGSSFQLFFPDILATRLLTKRWDGKESYKSPSSIICRIEYIVPAWEFRTEPVPGTVQERPYR